MDVLHECVMYCFNVSREVHFCVEHFAYIHFLQATLNWGKKDDPVYIIEEKGVVGLNFHQSKEPANGYYDVSHS